MIVVQIIIAILGAIRNIIVKTVNAIISIINKLIRKRNDRIKRGVKELKHGSIDDIIPLNAETCNMVVSGAYDNSRIRLLVRAVQNAHNQGYATVVLHEGNKNIGVELASALNGSDLIVVDENNPCYDPFAALSIRETCKVISDTATQDYDIKKNSNYYVEALCQYLTYKKVIPSLRSFYTCPHSIMFDKINDLVATGTISAADGQALQSKLMMGQSEQFKLETLFKDWYDQTESILNKRKGSVSYSVAKAIHEGKIIAVDVSSNVNALLINSVIVEIRQALTKGKRIVFVVDNLTTSGNEVVKKILSEKTEKCKTIICGSDLLSVCDGDDKVFNTIVGNAEQIAVLGHASGATCNKWAETIGYYDKDEESQSYQTGKMQHSPFALFPGSNTSTTKNYNIKREYIVKPEIINRMRQDEVFFYDHSANKLTHTFL